MEEKVTLLLKRMEQGKQLMLLDSTGGVTEVTGMEEEEMDKGEEEIGEVEGEEEMGEVEVEMGGMEAKVGVTGRETRTTHMIMKRSIGRYLKRKIRRLMIEH